LKTFLTLILSSIFLFGASKTIYLEVDGFGNSRDEAVRDALIEAIQQTKGVSINSKRVFSKKLKQESSLNGNATQKIDIAKLNNHRVKEITKGLVDSYRIIDIAKISSREYKAKLSVKILQYASVGLSNKNRRKIAILPFRTNTNSYKILNKNYLSTNISSMLSQALTTDITQSRKFAVVDRTYTDDIDSELNLINSNKVPLSQKIKLGQRLGADYILVGTIESASINHKTYTNRSTSQITSNYIANFVVAYRIIVVGTSQVKWSDTALVKMKLKNTLVKEIMLQKAINHVSSNITKKLLQNIYPIKIAKITQNGNVILNQGGSLIHKDDIYDILKLVIQSMIHTLKNH